jgi:hypothetical protein
MAVEWKLAYPLSYQNIEELMAEGEATLNHSILHQVTFSIKLYFRLVDRLLKMLIILELLQLIFSIAAYKRFCYGNGGIRYE